MKKLILFLLLLTQIAFGQTATGTTKAGKYQMNIPDLGAKNDSIVVWNGTSKLLKYVPASTISSVTNLNYTASPTTGIVNSSSGTNATLPVANTTNSGLFLPEEKIKLTFIETGAEVNVNSDWNSISGDSEILNKPAIPSIVGLASEAYVDAQDDLKVDKVVGERLINASEITNLSNQSGVNTGDNAVNSNYDNDYRADNFIGGTDYLAPNGSAAALTDFPILNQNTTGSANTITGNISQSQVTDLVTDLANKQATLVSGTNIKTVNGNSLVGSGDILISGGGSVPNGTLRTVGSGILTSTMQKVSDNLGNLSPLIISLTGVSATGNTASNNNNTVFGSTAGTAVSSANSFFGFSSGKVATSSNNCGFGSGTLFTLTTGGQNSAFGSSALQNLTTGTNNAVYGTNSALEMTTGNGNTVIGWNSHRGTLSGDSNIVIGNNSSPIATGSNYNVIIGSIPIIEKAVLQNTIIIADGQGNRKLVINQSNLATLPLQTAALINADVTGKAILTNEYLGTRIGTVAPATSTSTGTVGEIRVCNDGFIYWCTAVNTWIRSAGVTF